MALRYKRMWGQEAQKDTFTFEEFLAARVTVSWGAGNPYGSSQGYHSHPIWMGIWSISYIFDGFHLGKSIVIGVNLIDL